MSVKNVIIGVIKALKVLYDNTTSGLTAENGQAAIDEIQTNNPGIQFDTSKTASLSPGKLGWDNDNRTLSLGMNDDVNLSIGQEMYIYAKNVSEQEVQNGWPVRIGSSAPGFPEAVLVNSLEEESCCTIAIATETIQANDFGYFTTFGIVRGINTSALSAGVLIYLGDTDGSIIDTIPQNPNTVIQLGLCIVSDASDGTIFVDIQNYAGERNRQITKEPTGFSSPEDVVLSYDPITRKVTLTGTPEAYYRGKHIKELVSGWESPPHDDVDGHTYFLYYDGASFLWESDGAPFFTMVLIALVNYGTSNKYCLRECHGLMQWQSHRHLHTTIGTYKSSGGTLSGVTLLNTTAASRRPDISVAVINDEDIPTTLPALSSKLYTRFRLSGASTPVYTFESADIIALLVNNPYYNQFSSPNWIQTLLPANTVSSVWVYAIPVTSETNSQKYRFLFVQPQWYTQSQNSSDTAMASALAEELRRNSGELNLGNLSNQLPEYIAIGRIAIEYVSGNWVVGSIQDLTGTRFSQAASPSGNFLSAVSTDGVTILGTGTPTDPIYATGFFPDIKSGATQAAASASAGELWKTSGHVSLPDNVVLIGV